MHPCDVWAKAMTARLLRTACDRGPRVGRLGYLVREDTLD
jgi:hypothetical protein